MSSTSSTGPRGPVRPSFPSSWRRYAGARRARAHDRQELASILAGHHGGTMRNEMLAILDGS